LVKMHVLGLRQDAPGGEILVVRVDQTASAANDADSSSEAYHG
jgi:hypothetical protein